MDPSTVLPDGFHLLREAVRPGFYLCSPGGLHHCVARVASSTGFAHRVDWPVQEDPLSLGQLGRGCEANRQG